MRAPSVTYSYATNSASRLLAAALPDPPPEVGERDDRHRSEARVTGKKYGTGVTTDSRDQRIAAEFADGRPVEEICARYDVSEAYVERVVENAMTAGPTVRTGLQRRGLRIILAVLAAGLGWLLTANAAVALIAAVVTLVLLTVLAEERRRGPS